MMNEHSFKSRGLYALVMSYKPNSKPASEDVDFAAHVDDAITSSKEGGIANFRSSSGKAHGKSEMPWECAPLVFPELDKADDSQKVNALRRAGQFTKDYYDHRAQAEFVSYR